MLIFFDRGLFKKNFSKIFKNGEINFLQQKRNCYSVITSIATGLDF